METNTQQRLEEGHAGISSSKAKLLTDAKPALPMTRLYCVPDAMILRNIQGIWYMFMYLGAIAAAVTVEIQRHGDYQYTARYILPMKETAKTRERLQFCPRILSTLYE